jgi:hypothetical protein
MSVESNTPGVTTMGRNLSKSEQHTKSYGADISQGQSDVSDIARRKAKLDKKSTTSDTRSTKDDDTEN